MRGVDYSYTSCLLGIKFKHKYFREVVLLKKRMILSLVCTLILICFCSTALAAAILVREGSRGPAVRRVQTLLVEQGYLAGGVDGVCGPLTVTAIRKFQKDKGLEVDGICGNGTYRVLSGGQTYEPEPSAAAPAGSRVLYVSATAYSPQDPGLSDHTAMGTLLRRGVIAVDPSFIPFGTHVFIPGYGEAVAEDRGGFYGNHIDIAFDTHSEALSFGHQDMEIYILD